MGLLLTDSNDEADAFVRQQIGVATNNPNFQLSPHYGSLEVQVTDNLLVGSAEMVRAGVERWAKSGVRHLNFLTPRPFNGAMLKRFCNEVAPAFA